MKGKFPTIVMAVMALVMALSLAVVGLPTNKEAEAGDLGWTSLVTPSIAVGVFPFLDIFDLDLSPTPSTMYASVNDPLRWLLGGWLINGAGQIIGVARSANSGLTWTACSQPQNPAGVPPAGILSVAVAPDDANWLVTTDGATVWASADGGGTWAVYGTAATLPAAGANPRISSIAVGPLMGTQHPIAVGVVDTTAALHPQGVYIWGWGSPPALSWLGQNLGAAVTGNQDILAVAFSPNYGSDFTVMAVGNTAAATIVNLGDAKISQAPPLNWNAWGAPILYPGWPQAAVGAASAGACIALPDDFNGLLGSMQVGFVGTIGGVPDVYRVRNSGVLAMGAGIGPIWSLDIVGTIGGSAAIMAGAVLPSATAPYAVVAFTNQPWTAAPWWSSANKAPTGLTGLASVALASDYMTSGVAFCGTGGALNDESALSKTVDSGLTWNQISLIDTDVNWGIADLAASPAYATDKTLFIVTCTVSGGGFDSLWKSTMGGVLWERIDVMATTNETAIVRVSPDYTTDKTVYWAETGPFGANRIRVSSDDGAFFTNKPVAWAAATGINDMVVEDATTVYVASAATVGKSTDSASSWPTMGSTFAPVRHMIQDKGTGDLAMSGDAVIYVCTDTTTMTISIASQISGEGAGSIQWLAFSNNYATDKTIYAAGGGLVGLIWKITGLGNPAVLPTITQIARVPAPAAGLAVSDDGVLYCADTVAGGGVLRTVNPEATPVTLGTVPEFLRMVQGFTGLPVAPTITGMWTAAGASNMLWIRDVANPLVPALVLDRILEYRDILPMTPSPTSPADAATGVGTQVAGPIGEVMYYATLEWGAVTGALGYGLQIDTDAGFANPIVNIGIQTVGWAPTNPLSWWTITPINQPAHSYTTPAGAGSCLVPGACSNLLLVPATKYYWRVRVDNTALGTGSCVGRWSAGRSFTTGPGIAPEAPTILSPDPGEKDVGLKPTFTWTAVTGMTEYDFQLATDAGFTDKVVDVTLGDQQSYMPAEDLDEDTQYFWRVRGHDGTTTQWATGGFTTSVPTVTPIWVWVVIAIGAVVAIAVIVLIIRTRRPA